MGIAQRPGPGRAQQDTQVIRLEHAEAGDLTRILKEVFASTPRLTISADPRSNSIVLNGDSSTLRAIQNLIERLDTAGSRPRKK